MRIFPFSFLFLMILISFYFVMPANNNGEVENGENKTSVVTDDERKAFSFAKQDFVDSTVQEHTLYQDQTPYQEQVNVIRIPFVYPSNLSYKTKKEIYEIRKKAVQNSIFRNPNYEPSEYVFGQIVDNKPWMSMKLCLNRSDGKADIEGPSEEARYINNPALLVAPEYAFFACYCEDFGKKNLTPEIPLYLEYHSDKKEIVVVYKRLIYCNIPKVDTWFKFKGLNARDLGFKYMYVDKNKSTFAFKFKEDVNASNVVHEIQDFIHLGGACGQEGGCNNSSPEQPPLNFTNPCDSRYEDHSSEKVIYIKLWKERPKSPEDEADIVEKIVFKKP